MPTIVISGYYGAGNTGDEAILAAMLQGLRAKLPAAEIVVLSADPAATAVAHGVQAVHRGFGHGISAKIRLFCRADLLLSGGGGLFQDVYPQRVLPASVLYYGGICALARLCGCRIMFFAQGIGPLRGGLARGLTRFAANGAACIAVRDQDSADLLVALGVDKVAIHVTADPVMAWSPRPDSELFNRLGLAGGGPFLTTAVRPWPDRRYQRNLALILDRALDRWGFRPLFLPFAGRSDRESCLHIQSLMRQSRETVVLPDLTPEEVYAVIAGSSLVLGMRLHALVFAALAEVPMLGMAYDPKVKAFLVGIGHGDCICHLNDGPEKIWAMLSQIRADRSFFADGTREMLQMQKNLAQKNLDLVDEVLRMKAE